MRYVLIFFFLFTIQINAKTSNDYMYEKCMEADIKKRSIVTEEEKQDMKRKKSKEELEREDIEREKILTQKLLDITIIETNTSKTLIIKNKSYCGFDINTEMSINEELKKLKEFGKRIKINEHEEIKITKIK